jgi:imidazolonepropionase-like amidohydrolase
MENPSMKSVPSRPRPSVPRSGGPTPARPRALAAALAAAVLLSGPLDLQAQTISELQPSVLEYVSVPETLVALTHVTVVDGTGADPVADQTVVIGDGRIQAVGPRGEVRIPSGARVLELPGHTVIPGIVGIHNHTFYTTRGRSVQLSYSSPRLYLGSGVTTIRTTGASTPYAEVNMMQGIAAGEIPGPRMHLTGPYITGPGAGGMMSEVATAEEARRVVGYWAEEGATWFKAYTLISREALGAAVEEAHRRGLKFTGHLCSVSFREAVELGIDNLEHGYFTNSDWDPSKEPDRCPATMRTSLAGTDIDSEEVRETSRIMVDNGVSMTSTLAVYELSLPGRPPMEDRFREALAPEAYREYTATREAIARAADHTITETVYRKAGEFEVAFVRAGGLLGAGVDPTGNGGALPGFGDQRNHELLIEAGFTPLESLRIMTLNGARILGVDEEMGSIEAGKVADLVVIRGDPVSRPAEIRNVVTVFKDGVGYDSHRLIEAVRGVVGVR